MFRQGQTIKLVREVELFRVFFIGDLKENESRSDLLVGLFPHSRTGNKMELSPISISFCYVAETYSSAFSLQVDV